MADEQHNEPDIELDGAGILSTNTNNITGNAAPNSNAGRKPIYEITPELCKRVQNYASRGLNKQQICHCLGISDETLANYEKKSLEFMEAIKRGKALGIANMADRLMQQADSGNVAATIFYLKSQAGWKETQTIELDARKPFILELTMPKDNGDNQDKPAE